MQAEDELQLRREVRAAVFRAERLRRAGRALEADEQLAAELAGAQGRLAAAGAADPATTLRQWRLEDDAAWSIAHLIGEIVLDGFSDARAHPVRHEPAKPAATSSPEEPTPTGEPVMAFPEPPSGVPGLADLLDEMLTQERRARPRPS
ncbi:MAG: hypothetical protein QM691_03535 [Opitutaceae bacterium]